MMQEKRSQGRPARGDSEVGSHKIVEGMRCALRVMKTANVTRKDIATYAGVTPALVTYYFPDRNGLIEAATVPVMQNLVSAVASCFNALEPPRQQLWRAISILLEAFTHDGPIIQLFDQHRSSMAETAIPDLLGELDACLVSFFERWLQERSNTLYAATFLQKALVGICKSLGDDQATSSRQVDPDGSEPTARASMICAMLVGPASFEPDPVRTAREAMLC